MNGFLGFTALAVAASVALSVAGCDMRPQPYDPAVAQAAAGQGVNINQPACESNCSAMVNEPSGYADPGSEAQAAPRRIIVRHHRSIHPMPVTTTITTTVTIDPNLVTQ